MRKKILSSLQYIIFIGGGLALVWWQLSDMSDADRLEFNNALSNTNFTLLIPVVIMALCSHLSRAMRWKLLMEPLGYFPKLKNVFALTMVGYLANSAVPRVGEVLKCTMLAKYENLKADKLIGTILIERAFDLVTYLIFMLVTVLLQIDIVGGYVSEKFTSFTENGGTSTYIKLGVLILVILLIVYGIKKAVQIYPNNKIFITVKNFMSGVGKGFAAIKTLKKRKMFLIHTLFIWSMYMLQIYLGFKAMDGTAHLGIKAACAVLSLSTLAMIITPGGIGAFPLFVMETLVMYGISEPQGKAFGWLIWGVSTSIIIIAGVIAVILLPYFNKQKNENQLSSTT